MIKDKKSFTVVELLVVMTVIAILITLSIFGIQQVQKSTRATIENNTALLLKSQLSAYYNEYRQYPNQDLHMEQDKLCLCAPTNSGTYDCNNNCNDPNVYSHIDVEQPGMSTIGYIADDQIHSNAALCNYELTNGTVSSDSWMLFYSPTNESRPQDYYLATCTELGWKDFSQNPLPESTSFTPRSSGPFVR